MLSRTADHLFWMARYMERAENTARMLAVNYQMSLLPQSDEVAERGWRGLLSISELTGDFAKRHGPVTPKSVIDYMVSDAANGSSIRSCLMQARENARAVRGTLTTEVWETQNQTWLEFQRMVADDAFQKSPGEAFEWVKFRSHLSRGVTVGTMLQDEAFHFLRIGSFLERADNTARLLDVKYHLLLPANEQVGGSLDFFQWVAILRAVSAATAYHWVYRDRVKPWLVADLLILKLAMPRSLIYCYDALDRALGDLARIDGASGAAQRQARAVLSKLERASMTEIFQGGLHEFVTEFIEENGRLANAISEQYLFV